MMNGNIFLTNNIYIMYTFYSPSGEPICYAYTEASANTLKEILVDSTVIEIDFPEWAVND